MELKNCSECGKIFVHPTRRICNDCYNLEELDFKKVKEFLWKKNKSTVEEVHENTGVSTKKITKFIREGRLNTGNLPFELYLHCESCGEPILEGNYCEACRTKMVRDFGGAAEGQAKSQPKPNDATTKRNSQMFTADRIHKK